MVTVESQCGKVDWAYGLGSHPHHTFEVHGFLQRILELGRPASKSPHRPASLGDLELPGEKDGIQMAFQKWNTKKN